MADSYFGEKLFTRFDRANGDEVLTVKGTVNKTAFLLLLAALSWTWVLNRSLSKESFNPLFSPWMYLGIVGGLATAIITSIKKEWAPITAPLCAVLEGMAIGGISAVFQRSAFHADAVDAPLFVFGTLYAVDAPILVFGTLFTYLAAHRSGFIKANANVKLCVAAAAGGLSLLYLLKPILPGGFDITSFDFFCIMIRVGLVAVTALNIAIHFFFLNLVTRDGQRKGGIRKSMEWFSALLMITFIWLYIELLRLHSTLKDKK